MENSNMKYNIEQLSEMTLKEICEFIKNETNNAYQRGYEDGTVDTSMNLKTDANITENENDYYCLNSTEYEEGYKEGYKEGYESGYMTCKQFDYANPIDLFPASEQGDYEKDVFED